MGAMLESETTSTTIDDTPQAMKEEMTNQKAALELLQSAKGKYISPFDLRAE